MKVKDVMTEAAVCCNANTNVGAAVELLWANNCGMLPVVGNDGKIQGVVTDRDIAIAMGTKNRLPGEIAVGEIATKKAVTCKPEDEIHQSADQAESRSAGTRCGQRGYLWNPLRGRHHHSGDLGKWQRVLRTLPKKSSEH